MKHWNEFQSDALDYARSLKMFRDGNIVVFRATMTDGAEFTRDEAIALAKKIIAILETEDL